MVGSSTSTIKSVTDGSAIASGNCYTYDSAEAKRSLLSASYTSN